MQRRKSERSWRRKGKADILIPSRYARARQSAKSPRVEKLKFRVYAANGVDQWGTTRSFADDAIESFYRVVPRPLPHLPPRNRPSSSQRRRGWKATSHDLHIRRLPTTSRKLRNSRVNGTHASTPRCCRCTDISIYSDSHLNTKRDSASSKCIINLYYYIRSFRIVLNIASSVY